ARAHAELARRLLRRIPRVQLASRSGRRVALRSPVHEGRRGAEPRAEPARMLRTRVARACGHRGGGHLRTSIVVLLVAACSANGDVRPLAAVAGDLAPAHLVAPRDAGPVPGNVAGVSHARSIAADRELAVRPSAKPDHSRRWWTKVKGSDLVAGVALP